MIILRKNQTATLNSAKLKSFEDAMLAYLKGAYPDSSKQEGETQTRENIRKFLSQAEKYDITIEHDVARFIDLMYAWPYDLEKDPEMSWALEIIKQKDYTGTEKVDQFWEQSEKLIDEQLGEGSSEGGNIDNEG